MPFGLCNAPSAFQAFINKVLFSLIDTCIIVYLDNILIFSENKEDHEKHLKALFSKLLKNQLFCKISKCRFFCNKVDFLGYTISASGVSIAEDKLKAIKNYLTPKNRREVRGFLGLANFSRRFIN